VIDVVLQEDIDDAAAKIGMAFYRFDTFHCRSQKALENIGDATLDIFWQQAVISPDHGSHGDFDIRKHVGRRFEQRLNSEYHDQYRKNDEGVRPSESDNDKSVHKRNLTDVV
jgi:hypothetical protein